MRVEVVGRPADGDRRWIGGVLCRDLLGADGRPLLRKGHRLGAEDAASLAATTDRELHLLWLDRRDVDENTAAVRLAGAVCGPGVEAAPPVESQVRISAACAGLVRVDASRLAAINSVEGVTVFTVRDGLPVKRGRTLAGVKITGLAIPDDVLSEAERRGTPAGPAAPVVAVLPFQALRVAAVVRQRVGEELRRRFEDSLHSRVGWFGGSVTSVDYPEDRAATRESILAAAASADLLAVVGVASVDPVEETWCDLLDSGARVVRRGLPVHPGSSYWLMRLGEVPVIGVASCGMFARRSALDLLLARVFAGEPLDDAFLAGLGHGGLLQGGELSEALSYEGEPAAEPR